MSKAEIVRLLRTYVEEMARAEAYFESTRPGDPFARVAAGTIRVCREAVVFILDEAQKQE